jgi:hypothetical protein
MPTRVERNRNTQKFIRAVVLKDADNYKKQLLFFIQLCKIMSADCCASASKIEKKPKKIDFFQNLGDFFKS